MTKSTQVTALQSKVIELVKSTGVTTKTVDTNNSLILDTALLYNVVIFKLHPKGPNKEQMESLNKIHLSKLNKNTMGKVSSLASSKKLGDITAKCTDKDLASVKSAVEKATGEKSLSKIRKAVKNDPVVKKDKETKSVPLPEDMVKQAGFIQYFLSLSPADQYKIIEFAFNNTDPANAKDSDNIIPAESLAQVIALVPQIFAPALDKTT